MEPPDIVAWSSPIAGSRHRAFRAALDVVAELHEPVAIKQFHQSSIYTLCSSFGFVRFKRDILHSVSMVQVQWSDLPVEILSIIFQKLKDPCDVYRCGLVCVSWKSVVTTILPPFLLLSNVGGFSDDMTSFHFEASLNKQSCSLFNTQTNETHEIFLPEVEKCWFSGSSFGWLITICLEPPHEVHLLNPLTRDRIQLPAARQLRLRSDLRVITSASPLNPTCLVLAIDHLKGALAFCRPGDKSWTLFEDFSHRLDDVIHYKGEFYAVNSLGHLFHLHCNTPAAQKVLHLCPVEFLQDEPLHRNYLVELDGELLLVVRYMHMPFSSYFTYAFEVYELNRVEKVWIKVINIGVFESSIILVPTTWRPGRLNIFMSLH
ncbi:hypothetical protein LWI28_018925 [Acer negundo]|uniref:F-box domain-containing protein n=1 Tax=Acer negundo TaxID=4023 RepID=A0AAD5J6T5_ACENE|nr:hypothetical protein LWI28_018925 [Acer negundo]